MSDAERVRIMLELRAKRWTYKQIGKQLDMSANGVMQALRRVTDPDRYYKRKPGEVDPLEADDE